MVTISTDSAVIYERQNTSAVTDKKHNGYLAKL